MINKPLAYRMRPQTLEDVIGQTKIISFLKTLILNHALVSMVFYGPPGTGKTTLAKAFGKSFGINTISLNAVSDNKQVMQSAFEEAIRFEPSIVIIDEIHRLDKAKQDLLLPHLENGDFFLIGCTTANPLISLNPAIRSRTKLLETVSLTKEEIKEGIIRAIKAKEGLNSQSDFSIEAIDYLASISGGDMRFALNQLEVISLSYTKSHHVTLDDAKLISSAPNYLADLDGNEHYDTVSAFQKSIRGRDVDAAIYYLAKLLKAGDLEGCIRRLMVLAYEDIGLANPQAVDRCYQACQVALSVGLPEAMIPLGFSVIELALSPHSRSAAEAIEDAMSSVDEKPIRVKSYLRYNQPNVKTEDSYPYNSPDVWMHLEYLPEDIQGESFYHPKTTGKYERALKEEYEKLKAIQRTGNMQEAKLLAKRLKTN